MRHTCPDGKQTKLHRHGLIGTLEGVTYSCPNCGWNEAAQTILDNALALKGKIVAALR